MSRFRRGPLVYGVLALACLNALPVCVADEATRTLAERLSAVINGPHYRQARWGLLVVDAKTGETVYAHNADQLFVPASVTKVFSVAAALALLGADFRFETPLYRRGELTDGLLRGDLILVASGDLTLGGRTDARGQLAFRDHDHT